MAKYESEGEESRRRRARARADWRIRAGKLSEPPDDDLCETTTMAERVAMVWRTTRDAWAFTVRPMPVYVRSEVPGRVIRLEDT